MKFRKKPIVIEAIQWTGKNFDEVDEFCGNKLLKLWTHSNMDLKTLEGWMKVTLKDWIIKGIQGEFYPCKPDIFEQTYEEVKGEENE